MDNSLDLYPVCPVNGEYAIGSPLFRKMTITLSDGRKLVLNAPGNSDVNRYVNGLTVNGKKYDKNYFTHRQLLKGCEYRFRMSPVPDKTRNTGPSSAPSSYSGHLTPAK